MQSSMRGSGSKGAPEQVLRKTDMSCIKCPSAACSIGVMHRLVLRQLLGLELRTSIVF